jgi:cation:H+ antiporter
MIENLLGLALGLVGLFLGGQWLVTGASRLARSLGISALIVGLTVVAMGTSAPELLVSIDASLRGSPDIAVGNVVGSNIANIGLILGISGLIYPISVHVGLLRREIPIMIVVTLAAFVIFLDGMVSQVEGLLLVGGLIAFLAFMVVSARKEQKVDHHIPEDEDIIPPASINRVRELIRLVVGLVVLIIGAQLTVDNAVVMARAWGVSELIIGVTLVAVGTSLPELVTSVMAALRKESDIAIGNVVGSNIFNVLAILGITTFIQPIPVAGQIVRFDGLVMIAFAVLLLPFVMNRRLSRREAMIFLSAYIVYIIVAAATSLSAAP